MCKKCIEEGIAAGGGVAGASEQMFKAVVEDCLDMEACGRTCKEDLVDLLECAVADI